MPDGCIGAELDCENWREVTGLKCLDECKRKRDEAAFDSPHNSHLKLHSSLNFNSDFLLRKISGNLLFIYEQMRLAVFP